jgi:hypothetical protein
MPNDRFAGQRRFRIVFSAVSLAEVPADLLSIRSAWWFRRCDLTRIRFAQRIRILFQRWIRFDANWLWRYFRSAP